MVSTLLLFLLFLNQNPEMLRLNSHLIVTQTLFGWRPELLHCCCFQLVWFVFTKSKTQSSHKIQHLAIQLGLYLPRMPGKQSLLLVRSRSVCRSHMQANHSRVCVGQTETESLVFRKKRVCYVGRLHNHTSLNELDFLDFT